MKRRVVLTVASIFVALAALVAALWRIVDSRTFQFYGGIVNRVDMDQKVVALTFDDGPTQRTDEILSILRAENVKATFFLVGQSIEQYPEETKRIAAAGHEIGNHTYSHTRMVLRSYSYIASEIEKTDALIRAAGYGDTIQFRPPYGKKFILLPYYLKQHDRKTILWDLEPNSFPDVNSSADNIVQYVLKNTRPGSIILLHAMVDAGGHTVKSIPGIIEGLKAMGYKFVTVNKLLS